MSDAQPYTAEQLAVDVHHARLAACALSALQAVFPELGAKAAQAGEHLKVMEDAANSNPPVEGCSRIIRENAAAIIDLTREVVRVS